MAHQYQHRAPTLSAVGQREKRTERAFERFVEHGYAVREGDVSLGKTLQEAKLSDGGVNSPVKPLGARRHQEVRPFPGIVKNSGLVDRHQGFIVSLPIFLLF